MSKVNHKEISDYIYSVKTEDPHGFTSEELDEVVKKYPTINLEKFDSALTGITCAFIDNKIRIYPCDIVKAVVCGLENRELNQSEFD